MDLTLEAAGEQRAAALAHYSAALQLEAAGKMRESLAHYRQVIKADPTNAALAAHAAGLAMSYAGREEALALLQESIKANPNLPQPYLNLAEFLTTYAHEDPAKADEVVKTLAEALARFPKDASVYRAAVMLHLTRDARGQAVSLLEQALKQPGGDAAFWLALGRVAQEVWPPGQQEAKQQHRDKVNPFFENALRQAGADADAKLQVAQYYLLTNQLPQATALCEKIAADHRSLPARKLLYRLYEAAGKNDLAFATLQEVVKEDPADVEQRRQLAEECEQRRDYAQAAAHLEAAIQIGGGEAQDYSSLSQLLLQSNNFERLVQVCQRSISLFPEHLQFRVYAGMAHRFLQQWDKALAQFAEADAIAQATAPDQLNHRFFFQYGVTLERAGRFDDSSRQFEKSISLTPKENAPEAANTMNYLGYMWLEQNRNLDKAGELIKKANEIEPHSAAFVDSLGWWHFKKGDYQAALDELLRAEQLLRKLSPDEQAALDKAKATNSTDPKVQAAIAVLESKGRELQPEDAEIFDHIGQAYFKLGRKAKAVEYFQTASQLDPDNKEIKQRLDEAEGKAAPAVLPLEPAGDKPPAPAKAP